MNIEYSLLQSLVRAKSVRVQVVDGEYNLRLAFPSFQMPLNRIQLLLARTCQSAEFLRPQIVNDIVVRRMQFKFDFPTTTSSPAPDRASAKPRVMSDSLDGRRTRGIVNRPHRNKQPIFRCFHRQTDSPAIYIALWPSYFPCRRKGGFFSRPWPAPSRANEASAFGHSRDLGTSTQ